VIEKITPFVTMLTGDSETGVGGEYGTYDLVVKAIRRVPTACVPRVEIQQASENIATELQIEMGSAVVSRHQERSIDGTPWSLQMSFYPMGFVEQGAFRLAQPSDIA
jgi:GntR family transcriptional regulator